METWAHIRGLIVNISYFYVFIYKGQHSKWVSQISSC